MNFVSRWLRLRFGLDDLTGTKCKWCSHTILSNPAHSPIPVCRRCFALAYAQSRLGLWETLMDQFRDEAFAWNDRMSARDGASTDTVTEEVLAEDMTEVLRIQQAFDAAKTSGNEPEAARLWAQVIERLTAHGEFLEPLRQVKAQRASVLAAVRSDA